MVFLAAVEDETEPEKETVVGVGQYSLNRDMHTAEVALVVRDDYQGKGIGIELLHYLTYLAKRQGLLGFSAEVLSNISRSLKPGAKAVLNWVAMLRRSTNEDVAEGRFDPVTMVCSSEHPPREGHPPVPTFESGLSCRRSWSSSSASLGCPW
ncbi:MAG TPA: GNAT family N-acetyltransferase [Methanothrix sp.]|nr:GNAT family N-acetyltransferase [Methanothrix sp.]